jgi:putative flippase GtrA
MDVIQALLRSRKFVTALVSMLVSILVAVGVPEDIAAPLIASVTALAVAYIVGTAYEDGQEKASPYIELTRGDDE